ncbi:MAG: T9SS type A sorting domain-containing protein [Salinivirgaceae bacterium]
MKICFSLALLVLLNTCVFAQNNLYSYDASLKIPNHIDSFTADSINNLIHQNKKSDNGNWVNGFTVPGIVGTVYATATDSTNLYIGGSFMVAGNVLANNLAMWDGQNWHSIGEGDENGISGDDWAVQALAYYEGKLYVGGNFLKAGTVAANGVACWDGVQWNKLGNDSINGVTRRLVYEYDTLPNDTLFGGGFVYELFAHNNKVYLGGYFHFAGNKISEGIAAWDITNESWETFNGGLGTISEYDVAHAYAIEAKDNDIYVGGKFDMAGGVPVKNIAKWDGSNWYALDSIDAYAVFDLEFDPSGTLFSASFNASGPENKSCGIRKWNGTKWDSLPNPEGYNASFTRIKFHNNALFATGTISTNLGYYVASFAEWNGFEWKIIYGLGNAANEFFPANVFCLQKSNNKLYVAGGFTKAGELFPVNVVEWDWMQESWKLLDNGDAHQGIYNGTIETLHATKDTLYAGGSFSVAGGIYTRNIAKWGGTQWESVGSSYENGIKGRVFCILADSNNLYVGGYFGGAGTSEAYHIAKWDGTHWSSIGIGVGGVPGAHVNALAKIGNYLYVGGYFSIVGDDANYDLPANSMARFDLSTQRWEALGRSIEYVFGMPGLVTTMDVYDNKIYVGGEFFSVDDTFYENIAVLDQNKWTGIGENPNIGINGDIRTIKVINGEIYIGGILQPDNTDETFAIMKWDGKTWIGVGENLTAGSRYAYVNSIVPRDSGMIVSGYFTKAGSQNLNNLAYFDGNQWNDVGGGILPENLNIAIMDDALYVAGPVEMVNRDGFGVGIVRYNFNTPQDTVDTFIYNEKLTLGSYPNPFSEKTTIQFLVNSPETILLTIYNSQGQEVKQLLNQDFEPGNYQVDFNANNFPEGIYFFRLSSNTRSESGKLLLIH